MSVYVVLEESICPDRVIGHCKEWEAYGYRTPETKMLHVLINNNEKFRSSTIWIGPYH